MTRRLLLLPLLSGLLAATALAGPASAAHPSARAVASSAGPSVLASAAAHTRAAWLAETRVAMHGSRAYVGRRVDRGGSRLAVNLDIDNTSLATYYDQGTAVPVVLRFARYAHRQGVTLLWNTGRRATQLKAITRTLRREGYAVTEVCGRKAGEALVHSKKRCRRHFVREGYTLIANVGNRATDFRGAPAYGHAYRLPSYGDLLG